MKKKIRKVVKAVLPTNDKTPLDEPMGIVISRGGGDEVRSIFRAYIWGPAPESQSEPAFRVA
ncbi:MAG: hypothetical protein WKF55_16040 [Gemmatimonadaceae bacterium]